MFGKNTDSYRYWIQEWERYKNIPAALNYANFGSTCDANNFDYHYWNGTGFNFASSPQDMYYDNQLLEQYGKHLREGSIVFFSISEFAFLVDKYPTDYHNFKYYGYLDSRRILNYSAKKARMIKRYPGLLDNRYIKQEVKNFLKKYIIILKRNSGESESLENMSKRIMSNWMHEFAWEKEVKLTETQKESLTRSWDIFQSDLEYCYSHHLTAVVVIPPFIKYLKEIMPKEILEECLWRYIDKIRKKGIKIIDFWNGTELEDEKYYRTPICLNENGKEVFNKMLQMALLEDEGIPMEQETGNHPPINNVYELALYNGLTMASMAFGTGVIRRFYRNKALYCRDVIIAALRSVRYRKMVRFLKNDLTIQRTLESAVKYGYRMFDTGRLYGHSERYIGEILRKYHREDFFVITKVSDVDLIRYPDANTVHDNLLISLGHLNTEYVDAFLLHFPSGNWVSMYKDIENEYKEGRARSIGVCNFDIDELRELIDAVDIKPMICQIEIHPLNTKKELISFCHKNNIIVMAHTPTGHLKDDIVKTDIFLGLMEKYGKSAAQIIYRWHLQNGVIPIVSSTSKKHLVDNLLIFDFEISKEDMKKIDSLDKGLSFDKNNNKINDCPNFIYNI